MSLLKNATTLEQNNVFKFPLQNKKPFPKPKFTNKMAILKYSRTIALCHSYVVFLLFLKWAKYKQSFLLFAIKTCFAQQLSDSLKVTETSLNPVNIPLLNPHKQH